MLEAIAAWGVEAAVKQFIGMFALAVWDRKEQALYLVRDRLGIKPLYWGKMGHTFMFGSELKALRAHPDFHSSLNREALAGFLSYGYVPAPLSIYEHIQKLPPGMILRRSFDGQITQTPFWALEEVIIKGKTVRHAQNQSHEEALQELNALLNDAVSRRLIADVPLGAFLSGGIDSSLVTAIAQRHSAHPIQTFTIGFGEKDYNEAPFAKAIAAHLGTQHTDLQVTPRQAREVIPLLPKIYDEPFADSSQIPTFLISQLARQTVTVALSGDGGDEAFAGYSRYLWAKTLWRSANQLPFRGSFAALLKSLPPPLWNQLASLMPASKRPVNLGLKIHKVARAMMASTPEAFYDALVRYWADPSLILPGIRPSAPYFSPQLVDLVSQMQALDTATYLPDDVLTKVDRATMAVGLEVRVPLLDHRLIEWSWAQPHNLKIQGKTGKWALRQILYSYVPQELIDRPKAGFSLPLGSWLRGPLRDWAEYLLAPSALKDTFDPAPIRKLWHNHLKGYADHRDELWAILMFESWRREASEFAA
jgi:asparagine synthase (glutamine-hydrolysing)